MVLFVTDCGLWRGQLEHFLKATIQYPNRIGTQQNSFRLMKHKANILTIKRNTHFALLPTVEATSLKTQCYGRILLSFQSFLYEFCRKGYVMFVNRLSGRGNERFRVNHLIVALQWVCKIKNLTLVGWRTLLNFLI